MTQQAPPFYQDEAVSIFNKDSRDLSGLETQGISLVLTDPPYGVREDEWDDRLEFVYFGAEYITRLLTIAPVVLWFASGKMLSHFVGLPDYQRILTWSKPLGSQYAGASHNHLWYSSESILVFGKKEALKAKGLDSRWSGDVFSAAPVPEKAFGHPTSKPESLISWLLLHFSNPGDLVFDPFLGSGTTAWCAKQLGRRCIGYDISETFCATAADRCRQGVMALGVG